MGGLGWTGLGWVHLGDSASSGRSGWNWLLLETWVPICCTCVYSGLGQQGCSQPAGVLLMVISQAQESQAPAKLYFVSHLLAFCWSKQVAWLVLNSRWSRETALHGGGAGKSHYLWRIKIKCRIQFFLDICFCFMCWYLQKGGFQ